MREIVYLFLIFVALICGMGIGYLIRVSGEERGE